MSSLLFERDLLYPTQNILDPGILHVKILNPNSSKMPVVLEPKSQHSTIQHFSSVAEVLQTDIFDRLKIKLSENTIVYILPVEQDKANYPEAKCLKAVFKGENKFDFEPTDEYNA